MTYARKSNLFFEVAILLILYFIRGAILPLFVDFIKVLSNTGLLYSVCWTSLLTVYLITFKMFKNLFV